MVPIHHPPGEPIIPQDLLEVREGDQLSIRSAYVDAIALHKIRAHDVADTVTKQEARHVGRHLYARAKFRKLGGGLEDRDVGAAPCEGDGCHETAEPAAAESHFDVSAVP